MPRLALPSLVMLAWCSTAPAAVDFDSEVAPIFRARCLNCHARGKYKAGLSLETRDPTAGCPPRATRSPPSKSG